MGIELRDILVAVLTILCSVFVTRAMRRAFSRFRSREQKAGKELIYRHFPKQKKSLGGGIAVFIALIAGTLIALLLRVDLRLWGWQGMCIWLGCGVLFAAIGFIDDWRKVNAARGLNEWAKLSLQFLAAIACTLLIVSVREIPGNAIFFPFVGWITLGWLFLPLGVLVIVAASNAVNLTDGLDGLAGSSLAIAFAGYLALGGLLQHPTLPPAAPLIACCALVGFLIFNRPPAKIIMGDTGALGLGAALGAMALLSGTEWLLLLIAAPFVIDTVSVVLQVTVIKFFRGPVRLLRHQTTEVFRPFLCTPLHHHFQWLTWGPWPILALFTGVGVLAVMLALLAQPAAAGRVAFGWFWWAGLLLQAGVLIFAALQKIVRANYFLGVEPAEEGERMLALYKGLPVEVFGMRWYNLEEVAAITEGMVNAIAAEGILWRNISEIEARATLGKIYAEYKLFDKAADEWEEIPLRNLLIRENLVVQLGKIYFGRDEFLRAIKLWEQLPPARLEKIPGLLETIQSAKIRVGHLSGRLYHQAREQVARLRDRLEKVPQARVSSEAPALIAALEGALRYTQDLRDLLAYEQQKTEAGLGITETSSDGQNLYRRMDIMLAARREELLEDLQWLQALTEAAPVEPSPLQQLSSLLQMTPAEISRALQVKGELEITEIERIARPSRNTLYRLYLDGNEQHLPERLVVKCYEEAQVTFFSACYRRERGVMSILQEVDAPVPRTFGGHLGSRMAVIFLEDLGARDLASALSALAPDDRSGRLELMRRGLDTLIALHARALPVTARLEREIAKIVKEVLTPEYYLNATTIALNRILALERRQLSTQERGRLEVALRPLVAALQEEPRSFIHFEYTPGNLQLVDGRVVAMDFEQSTMGPIAFDLATLLYAHEADLTDAERDGLLARYHELLPASVPEALTMRREALDAAAVLKLIFYAGSAANFYRKFEEGQRLAAMEWYLQTADRLLTRTPAFRELNDVLRSSWSGQRHLVV
jgi:phospho-N-acetylmuramoyl-pentapeptide-transferase